MRLSEDDARLFYELWFQLLDFVNERIGINPVIGKIHGAEKTDPMDVKMIADVLWDSPELIDEYLKKHGRRHPAEHRNIISGWKKCIKGRFVLERHLRSGSVFIDPEAGEVYLVSGIVSSWEEIFFYRRPPIMMEAVLIPFKDVIITDGLVFPYNIAFGKGYSSEFKDIYMSAK